ncbi:hypothetical protein AMJ87_13465 [candidate division WOR_3 bacterium SM23_60]|uniref:Delta-aminolevulinic acid dehydratase n=1 Tax=candidate division WOR_3 bacterium SM23_60 TaxID=1703780 RepID=A0A0S8G553_UNCW3|nr:MAG: hypothetical protein AMJ87_13465 [candidate division WOR_3 bacterium SM23_60]
MIESVISRLKNFVEQDDWCGWDPYDALNSAFLRYLTFDKKWLRIAAIHFLKRSPVNLRSLVGVPKSRHPKALGLLARAYLIQYKKTNNEKYLENALRILGWLESNNIHRAGRAWGHNFDWQSSVFYVTQRVPTAVNTSFIAHAFIDAYELTSKEHFLSVARSSCDFILRDLNRSEQNQSICFSYTPIDQTRIHNANALAAELLARVSTITKEESLHTVATQSLFFTLQRQNDDGSWFYGIGPGLDYIDSFHTGFVLVALHNALINLGLFNEHKQHLMRGYQYYKETFFDRSGMPHYASDRVYPLDLHATAQGIITCIAFKDEDSNALSTAHELANWALENMWDERKGYFYFQKNRWYINRIPYLRWPNAWMYYALALLSAESEEHGAKG